MAERIIVTSALPYANGPIHFGHAVGAYLPADVYVRFRRMRGDEVHFVCGTDEHGVAITLKAEQAGQSYQDYVDHWHREIHRTLTGLGIEFDVFSGTSHRRNPHHRALSQQFFLDLKNNGYLFEKTEEQFYSEASKRFLPDRYVEGGCYVCGFAKARGDECPKCGTWLDAKRLQDPRSTIDGSKPVLKATTHWYLDLPKIRSEWLQDWFEGKHDDWKVNVRAFVEEALKDLRERPVTRDLPWGVPLPLPGTDGKVLYVWFDAPIGYLSISKQWFERQGDLAGFERLWQDPDTQLFHFIGKDNITFHVVVFPAMLWGTKGGWIVPANVPANEFFNLEGRKFNTSKGWYIPEESVQGRFSVDALRWALTAMMPETADSDWSWKEFQARVNGELADNLGNFVARTLRFAERYLDGSIPPLGRMLRQDEAILDEARAAADEVAEALLAFQFRRAATRLMTFSGACNKYYDAEQPWTTRKTDPPRCGQTIRVCAELVRNLGVMVAPFMPQTSRSILGALGIEGAPKWKDVGPAGLPIEAVPVKPLDVLFPKIDDAVIEGEVLRLKQMEKTMETQGSVTPPPPPAPKAPGDAAATTIAFEDFAKLDLRVGTVLASEKHPKADRLLVLKVDLGTEVRTVVAGVAESYAPEELVGRKVVVVANLAPRALRGVESQGMILATDDPNGKPRFLTPDGASANGTKVK